MTISALTDIASCTLWLKGDAGTYEDTGLTIPAADNGDPVKGWDDQAGTNNVTEATSNPALLTNALDSKNAVDFDGGDELDLPSMFDSTYDNAFTFYTAYAVDSVATSTKPIVFSLAADLRLFYMIDSTGWPNADVNVDNLTMESQVNPGDSINKFKIKIPSSTGNRLVCMSVGASFAYCECDRFGLVRRLTAGGMGLTAGGVLGRYTGGGFQLDGKIFEHGVWKRNLSGSEHGDVHDYFATRWPTILGGGLTLVYCDGDSLTAGSPSANNGNSYPYQLLQSLGSSYRVINAGVSGTQLNTMEGDASTRVDGYKQATGNVCVAWGGTNDLFFGTAVATVQTRYSTYCSSRQTAGWRVVAVTMLPRSDAGTPAGFETDRQTFNTWLRANYTTFADSLADIAADSRIGDDNDEQDTTYYNADLVHMNATGYGVVAGIVNTAVLETGSKSPPPTRHRPTRFFRRLA